MHCFYSKATALVHIYTDGSVLISHGGIEMGQGLNTKMIQVASRALQLTSSKIHIQQTSTEIIANASPTGGSTGTDINGAAVQDACDILLQRLAPYRKSGVSWEDSVAAAYFDQVIYLHWIFRIRIFHLIMYQWDVDDIFFRGIS